MSLFMIEFSRHIFEWFRIVCNRFHKLWGLKVTWNGKSRIGNTVCLHLKCDVVFVGGPLYGRCWGKWNTVDFLVVCKFVDRSLFIFRSIKCWIYESKEESFNVRIVFESQKGFYALNEWFCYAIFLVVGYCTFLTY